MKELLKEIKKEVWQLSPTRKELRRFGLMVGGIFAVLSAYFYYREPSQWEVALGALGAALVMVGLLFPLSLKWPHRLWMTLGMLLGFVVSHVILTALFYLIITPIAVLKRLVTKKSKNEPDSYWQAHPDTDWSKAMEEMS